MFVAPSLPSLLLPLTQVYLPLMVGTVPIYFGAPNVVDYVPYRSIILLTDFPSIRHLSQYLHCIVHTKPHLYEFYWRNRTTDRRQPL